MRQVGCRGGERRTDLEEDCGNEYEYERKLRKDSKHVDCERKVRLKEHKDDEIEQRHKETDEETDRLLLLGNQLNISGDEEALQDYEWLPIAAFVWEVRDAKEEVG